MYVKTHVMMLHSEFCAVCSSLSDVSAKRIVLINIHEWSRATVRSCILMSKILFAETSDREEQTAQNSL